MPLKKVDKATTASPESKSHGGGYMDDLMPFIKKGTVIPIISNSIRIDQIFNDEETLAKQISGTAEFDGNSETPNEELTRVWAEKINYPMAEANNLARVAQFYQVELKDPETAKMRYLQFITNYLLDVNEGDENYQDDVRQMRKQNAPFSQIVQKLDHPRFPSGMKDQDPLRILAKLPLKIYITTSYYNFMEQALEAVGRHPRTEVCFWSRDKSSALPALSVSSTQASDSKYIPPDEKSDEEEPPVVYHLFGLEDNLQTLVLSEDDYMNFLISVVQDINTGKPVVPLWLREGLTGSRLLLLGYRVQDWDFRVLFKFISHYRENNKSAPRGMLIQMEPGSSQLENKEKSIEYLNQYFDTEKFNIDWTSPEKFTQKLWIEWDKYRKGEA